MYINSASIVSYYSIQSVNKNDNSPNLNQTTEANKTKTFDFAQISRGDLLQTVNNLIKNGEIDLDESGSLVPLMGAKMSLGGDVRNSSNEIINVFDMLKQSISFNQSIGNTTGVLYDTKAFDALKRLQGSTSGINILT